MMVIAVGLSSYNVALFHLVNHAFYKALLFLGAGAVIHAVADNQDFRKYGGLIPFLPLTYTVMLIASLSLVAFPFMTGFYSKDFILESAYGQFNFSSVAVYFIATIGAMFTTLYSVKVLYLTFLTGANGPLINYKRAHEGDVFMNLPLIILAVFSIFFGYITKDMFIGMASSFFSDNSLFTHPLHEIMLDTEFAVPTLFKLLPFALTITLSALSLILSEFLVRSLISFKFTRLGYNIFSFFNQRFLIELFYNRYITRFILKLGGHTTKVLDKGSIELLGPYGLEKGLFILSKSLNSLDTGVITTYALYILIGLILYILIPYISLIEIRISLCIAFALLNTSLNMPSLGLAKAIPHPHPSAYNTIHSGLSTPRLFISIFVGVGLSLAYRLPLRIILGELDLCQYYPLFNLIITLCGIAVVANLLGNKIRPSQVCLAIFFTLLVILLLLYGRDNLMELFALLCMFSAHLPYMWNGIQDIWFTVKGHTITIDSGYVLHVDQNTHPGNLNTGDNSTRGAGSSTGGAASSSSAGVGSSQASSGNAQNTPASTSNTLDPHPHGDTITRLRHTVDSNRTRLDDILREETESQKKYKFIDPAVVATCLRDYYHFYNIKIAAKMEYDILKTKRDLIRREGSDVSPFLSITYRENQLAGVMQECNDNMTRLHNTYPGKFKRVINTDKRINKD